jgi:hypothetical protein
MDRSEIRTGAVLAIVASYTMIALDISIVITALCSPVRMCMHRRLDRTRAVRRRCARYRVNPSASNDLDETSALLHIANLRRKIEPASGERLIHTDHGVGYCLADVHPEMHNTSTACGRSDRSRTRSQSRFRVTHLI